MSGREVAAIAGRDDITIAIGVLHHSIPFRRLSLSLSTSSSSSSDKAGTIDPGDDDDNDGDDAVRARSWPN